MSAAGFSYPVESKPSDQTFLDQFIEHRDADLNSLSQAKSFGFQLPPSGFKFSTKVETLLPSFAAEQRKHGAAWASALLGAARRAAWFVAAGLPCGRRTRCCSATSTGISTAGWRSRPCSTPRGTGPGPICTCSRYSGPGRPAWPSTGCTTSRASTWSGTGPGQTHRRRPRSQPRWRTRAAVSRPTWRTPTSLWRPPTSRPRWARTSRRSSRCRSTSWPCSGAGEQVLRLPTADLLRLSRVRVSQASSLLVPRH
jgi:hypothetical protein